MDQGYPSVCRWRGRVPLWWWEQGGWGRPAWMGPDEAFPGTRMRMKASSAGLQVKFSAQRAAGRAEIDGGNQRVAAGDRPRKAVMGFQGGLFLISGPSEGVSLLLGASLTMDGLLGV